MRLAEKLDWKGLSHLMSSNKKQKNLDNKPNEEAQCQY
jgi:hypothetical protein